MKKFINLKAFFIVLLLLIIYTIISAISYTTTVSQNISNGVFRLHVIANSNSNEDQELKLIVRDNLISYMNSLTINATSKEEAIQLAKEHKEDFYKIATQTIKNNGYNYDVKIEIGNFYFPTKDYGDISFPCGYYDALKVEIGSAER